MSKRVHSQNDLISILNQRLNPLKEEIQNRKRKNPYMISSQLTILFEDIELYNDTEELIEYNLSTILQSAGMLQINSNSFNSCRGTIDFKGLVIGDNISFICENFSFDSNILNIEYLLCQDLKFTHCVFAHGFIFKAPQKNRKYNITIKNCRIDSKIQINVPCKKLILSECTHHQDITLSNKIDNLELYRVDLTKMIFDKFKADNISLKNIHTNSLCITSEKDTDEVANLVLSDKKLKTLSIESCSFNNFLKIQNISSISLLSLEQGNIGNFTSKNSTIETLKINNITGAKISLIDSAITLFDYIDNAERSDKTLQQKTFEFNNTSIQRISFLGVEDQSIVFSDKESTEGFYTFFSSDFNQIEFIDFKNKNIQSISLFNSIVNLDFQNLKEINQIFCNESSITHNKDRVLSNLKITDITLINSELKNTVFNKCEFTNFILKNNDPKISKLNNCQFNTCKFNEDFNAKFSTLTEVSFSQSTFTKRAEFVESEIYNCNFSFAEFKNKADFSYANFRGKNKKFEYIHFKDRGAFYGAFFEENPVFHNLILEKDSHLYFGQLNKIHEYKKKHETDAKFKTRREKEKQEGKTEKDIRINTFTIKNTIINGRLDFNEDNITTLDMKGSIVVGTLSRVLFDPICANWETATLLKNEELKQNNLIKALGYKAEEKDLYEYELWIQLNNKNWFMSLLLILYVLLLPIALPLSIIKIFVTPKNYNTQEIPLTKKSGIKLITEWLSLWIGKVSNNHGQSWGQGIFFTAGVWFVCFGMFYLPSLLIAFHDKNYLMLLWDTLNSNVFFANILDYLNPTNYTVLKEYFVSKTWYMRISEIIGMFWFLLGKALVPYGIFEVVQAFRKYNKID